MSGIGGHTAPNSGATDTWLTPPEIVEALGPFDLDPCCPAVMPWATAARSIHWPENGLTEPWAGRVWLNPPYSQIGRWLGKLAHHGDGVALTFARTETQWFFDTVWDHATAILFVQGRLHFHHENGERAKGNSGGPSALVAYGEANAKRLDEAPIAGRLVWL